MAFKRHVFIAMAMLLFSYPTHADLPQFLGSDRTGISSEIDLLTTWSQKGPEVVREMELGEGFSGISVADGRVYTMFSAGEDEFVICLDEKTGKELWRVKTGYKLFERIGGNGPVHSPLLMATVSLSQAKLP